MEYAVREGMICAKLGTMVKKLVEEDLMPPECSIPFESEILLGIGISCQRLDRRGIIYKMAMSGGETRGRKEGTAKATTAGRFIVVGLIWKINIVSGGTAAGRFPDPSSSPARPPLPTGIELLGAAACAWPRGVDRRNGTGPVKRAVRRPNEFIKHTARYCAG